MKLVAMWQIVWALEALVVLLEAYGGDAWGCFLGALMGGLTMTFWSQARKDLKEERSR